MVERGLAGLVAARPFDARAEPRLAATVAGARRPRERHVYKLGDYGLASGDLPTAADPG
jgi:hypothetical protein